MSEPLSVCILACNEAEELERCLASVAWADEVVVLVDARSQDDSERIARERASRVEVQPYAGDVEQKRTCTGLAKHDWVLIVDPDEVVTPDLARSIRAVLAGGTSAIPGAGCDGYRVDRVTHHLGRWIRHGDFYPDWKLRLFRRSRARWLGRDPHGRVEVDGAVGRLRGALEHYSYRDLADQIDRIQFFSDQAAAALAAEGERFRLRWLIGHPPARFVRAYVLRRGFLDGLPGLVIAVASAFYVFLKYAKLWERSRVRAEGRPGARGSSGA